MNKFYRRASLLAIFAACQWGLPATRAADTSFTGMVSTDFNLAGNWSAGVPMTGDTGIFDQATGSNALLSANASFQQFSVGNTVATIGVDNFTLSLSSGIDIGNTSTNNAASPSGNLSFGGANGFVVVTGAVDIGTAPPATSTGFNSLNVINSATLTAGSLNVGNSGVASTLDTFMLDSTSSTTVTGATTVNGTGTINSSGTFSTDTLVIGTNGAVNISDGTFTATSGVTFQGALNISGGALVASTLSADGSGKVAHLFSGSVHLTGLDTAGNGLTLSTDPSSPFGDTPTFGFSQKLTVDNNIELADATATMNFAGGNVSAGSITNAGGGTVAITAGSFGSLTLTDGGTQEIISGGSLGDSVTLASGMSLNTFGTLDLGDGSANVTVQGGALSAATITNTGGGALSLTSGTITINGVDTNGNGLTLGSGDTSAPFGDTLTLSTGQTVNVTNALVLEDGGASLTVSGGNLSTGSIVNSSGGSVSFTSGVITLTGSDANGNGLTIGSGDPAAPFGDSLTLGANQSLIVTNNVVLEDGTASISVLGGSLTAGSISAASGSFVILGPGGALTLTASDLTFTSAINGGFVEDSANLDAANLTLNNNVVTVGGTATVASDETLILTNGSSLNGGALDIAGTLGNGDSSANSISASGTTTIEGSGTLNLTAANATFSTGQFINNGTFNWTAGTVTITGAGGLAIGNSGPLGDAPSLNAQQSLVVTNTLDLADGGATIDFAGGNLTAAQITNSGGGAIVIGAGTSGSLRLTGMDGNGDGLIMQSGGPLGESATLGSGFTLWVDNTLELGDGGATIVFRGGTLIVAQVANGAQDGVINGGGAITIDANASGTLHITQADSNGDGLVIAPGGPLGSTVTLGNSMVINVDQQTLFGTGASVAFTGQNSSFSTAAIDPASTGVGVFSFSATSSGNALNVTAGDVHVGTGDVFGATFTLQGAAAGPANTMSVSGTTFVDAGGILEVKTGGSLTTFSMDVTGGGAGSVHFTGGSITLTDFNTNVVLDTVDDASAGVFFGDTLNMSGPGQSLNVAGNVTVGDAGTGSLTLGSTAVLSVTSSLTIGNQGGSVGEMDVNGGSVTLFADINSPQVGVDGTGTLHVNSGTVTDYGDLDIGSTSTGTGHVLIGDGGSNLATVTVFGFVNIAGLGGAGDLTVGTNGNLTLINEAIEVNSGGSLTIQGSVTSPQIFNNGGAITWTSGSVSLTNDGLFIGTGGLFGSTITLQSGTSNTATLSVQGDGNPQNDGTTDGTTEILADGALNLQPGGSFTTGFLIVDVGGQLNYSGGNLVLNNNAVELGTAHAVADAIVPNVIGNTIPAGSNITAQNGVTIDSGYTLSLQGAITSPAGITNNGRINGGGTIGGSLVNNGVYAPGDPVISTVLGDFTQSAGGELDIGIAGTTPGGSNGYDQIQVSDNITLGGDLVVDFLNGFVPSNSDQFTILTTIADPSGSFANEVNGKIDTSLGTFDVVIQGGDVVLDDFTPNSAPPPVPEPASLALLALGGTGLLMRRRGKKS